MEKVMKKMSTTLLPLFILSTNVFADSDYFAIAPINFTLNTPNAHEKLLNTIRNPEGLLKKYKPEGAILTKKSVSHNEIKFYATKKIAFISKTVLVRGIVDSEENVSGCKSNETAYKLKLSLEGSDGIVVDNIDRMEGILCTYDKSKTIITGTMYPKIYKGQDYTNTIGSIAEGIIEAQINPIIKALAEDVQSQK
jgi:hypothetical protein